MKAINRLFLVAALMLCLGATCNNERKSYNTIATIEQGVDASVKSYLDLVVANKIPTNSVPKVMQDYDVFQESVRVAIKSSAGNSNALAPADMIVKSVNVQSGITAAKGGK